MIKINLKTNNFNHLMNVIDKLKCPSSVKLNKNNKSFPLIIHGQGVFLFSNNDSYIHNPCEFYLMNKDETDGIKVTFGYNSLIIYRLSLPEHIHKSDKGLIHVNEAYYWFSLDSQNQKLYAGIGEARIETTICSFSFPINRHKKENKLFLESLVTINIGSDNTVPIRLIRDPITDYVPLLVKNIQGLSMNDIASGKFLPQANLSKAGQQLYNCISGINFMLDSEDFPEFSKAIEYSIRTQGKWCYEKLKDKAAEFNKEHPNSKETYLRITLGQNNGESPGIPYVMEIWPVGHYSPIHNHAGANAIIRVLHGSINVQLFPFLSNKVQSFSNENFTKNNVTWISPTLNQTHQLKNLESNKDTCITIQCYMYDELNKNHYDYFDYLDTSGNILQYEPDSDMDFIEFKQKMKNEWYNRPQSWLDYLKSFLFR